MDTLARQHIGTLKANYYEKFRLEQIILWIFQD